MLSDLVKQVRLEHHLRLKLTQDFSIVANSEVNQS